MKLIQINKAQQTRAPGWFMLAAILAVLWNGVGVADYNVWRSSDRQFTKASHVGATGGTTSLVDPGAQALSGVHYYLVRSVNSCRWESD